MIVDIERTTEILLALLRSPTTVPEAQDLERRVLSSFKQYLSSTEVETERRVLATSDLVLFHKSEAHVLVLALAASRCKRLSRCLK